MKETCEKVAISLYFAYRRYTAALTVSAPGQCQAFLGTGLKVYRAPRTHVPAHFIVRTTIQHTGALTATSFFIVISFFLIDNVFAPILW